MAFVATADDLRLDASCIIDWTWSLGDSQIINAVQLEYDWDLAAARGIYATRQTYAHEPSVGKYGRRAPLQIQSRGIRTDLGGQLLADRRVLEVMRRFAEPPPVLSLAVFYQRHPIEPGDQLRVTHPDIPNPATGLRGMTGQLFEVVDATPQFGAEGLMRLTLVWLWSAPPVAAPTAGDAVARRVPLGDEQAPAVPTGLALAVTTGADADGSIASILTASWDANTEDDLATYQVQFKRAADSDWTPRWVGKATSLREVVIGNVSYQVRVQAIDTSGNESGFTSVATITSAKDTSAPSAPSATTVRQATGKTAEIEFTFTPPADWATTVLYRHTSNDSSGASIIETKKATKFHDANVAFGSTYYYWAKVIDTSGNASGFSPSSSNGITIGQVGTGDIAPENISDQAVYTNSGSVSLPTGGTTEYEIGSVTLTLLTSVDQVEIQARASVTLPLKTDGGKGGGTATVGVWMRIRRDSLTGTQIDRWSSGGPQGGALIGRDEPGVAGSTTYVFTAQAMENPDHTAGSVDFRKLVATRRSR